MINNPWGGGVGWGGWGGMITFMFLCTHRHSNLIIFLPVEQRQAQLFHDQLPVGWGELIRFMFLCLHTHSSLIIFLAVEHLHLWDERSCVKWVVLVVRWAEIREMSCVSCEMSGVVWDELCELWDELCERTWVKFSERTRSSSTKCHTKAALERVELCEMSWVRWVVWDELCDLWDERSCVRWNGCIVWDNLSEVERERSNSGGEGGEGTEYKHKNKSPTQRCEEKNHNLMSCVMMLKKARRRIMLQSYNDKITQQKRAQTTNRLTCTNDPLLTCTDDPSTNGCWAIWGEAWGWGIAVAAGGSSEVDVQISPLMLPSGEDLLGDSQWLIDQI